MSTTEPLCDLRMIKADYRLVTKIVNLATAFG
jgi:hypothetical protein